MSKRYLATAFFTGILGWSVVCLAAAQAGAETSAAGGGYGGIEFYGSSQISRAELDKEARLKPGAQPESVQKAADRLRKLLSQRNLESNVSVVADNGERCYIVVDLEDALGDGVPVRKMVSPHHVAVSNEQPFVIRQELARRLIKLLDEGRPVSTAIADDGTLVFSDEPCNQLAKKLVVLVPPIRSQLLEVIANDPDPMRRAEAVVLLNWDRQSLSNCLDLIPALDDASAHVRNMTDQLIIPRLKALPDNFPIQDLIEAFSHQLCRPSHLDRVQALKALTAIAQSHPFALGTIKAADEERLTQLQSQSLLTTVKQPASQLLQSFKSLPAPPVRSRTPQLNEF